MRVEFYQPAGHYYVEGKGTFPERFAQTAFEKVVGKRVPLKIAGRETGFEAEVIRVVVDPDGLGATWTVELLNDVGGDVIDGLLGGLHWPGSWMGREAGS